jgi:hypothetical protein
MGAQRIGHVPGYFLDERNSSDPGSGTELKESRQATVRVEAGSG